MAAAWLRTNGLFESTLSETNRLFASPKARSGFPIGGPSNFTGAGSYGSPQMIKVPAPDSSKLASLEAPCSTHL